MNSEDYKIAYENVMIANKMLEQEIERLKELCDKYEEEHKTTFETWQKDIKENKKLHSIIKKVREYIKEKYIEDYSNNDNYIPLEKLNLKNCSWERSLQVLEIIDKENK